MANQNYYKANLRDLSFLLFEQFHLEDLLNAAPFAAWGKDEVTTVLEQAYEWVQQHMGPYNASGDQEGCHLENGQSRSRPGSSRPGRPCSRPAGARSPSRRSTAVRAARSRSR